LTGFAHPLPFGAEVGEGRVRFRIWAPGESRLDLVLNDRQLEMEPQPDGWFELVSEQAAPGDRYGFKVRDGLIVPDPAARFQPDDVHAKSEVIDPRAYAWQTPGWTGRPFEEVILYELNVGAFTEDGTFDGLRRKLDELIDLGISAVELMPVADFPGTRGWGYDGVLWYAPESTYGRPEDLKRLIDEAHSRGLMVFLDVVYNHFGPDGNYLHVYAKDFFDHSVQTPWGDAIDYNKRVVRDFAIQNVLYWLEEYRFDGLRFDAVDRIIDAGEIHLLDEIADTVRARITDRHVHLVLENDANESVRYERHPDGRAKRYDAQWNDDIHHVFHHLLTGEAGGYYADYAGRGHEFMAKALGSGFVYQGEPSRHRDGELRGQPSGHLPPTAFVAFIQNHDQVGNRAFGERIGDLAAEPAIRAMTAVLLLMPQIPLLFMGEEWAATQPFCYFTDFHDELADAVRDGRRREFAKFPQFQDPAVREHIPDPNALSTFEASRLDRTVRDQPDHARHLHFVKHLLRIRRQEIIPRLAGAGHDGAGRLGTTGVRGHWRLGDGSRLELVANLGAEPLSGIDAPSGTLLYESSAGLVEALPGTLPPWAVLWSRTAS
jgi:malto-oligosyltrehalose trehalohydrolase